jgi:hypothetical protein
MATSVLLVTLMVRPCAGFALAAVGGVVALTGCTKRIFATLLVLVALRSRTITTLAMSAATGSVTNITVVARQAATAVPSAVAAVLATAATVTPTAITVSSLLSAAVGAGLTAAIAALTTAALLTTASTAVTSATAEATTMPPTTLSAASAIAPAVPTVTFGRNAASGSGNNLELRQASNRQRPLEQPLDVLEQRRLIRRYQ